MSATLLQFNLAIFFRGKIILILSVLVIVCENVYKGDNLETKISIYQQILVEKLYIIFLNDDNLTLSTKQSMMTHLIQWDSLY